jgi:hypothetical protein
MTPRQQRDMPVIVGVVMLVFLTGVLAAWNYGLQ